MPARRIVCAVALAGLVLAAAACGSDRSVVRIGVLSDCQGPFRGFQDVQLSGAELPFLRRGASLVGTAPSGGVTAIEIGGRRVELVQGCQEAGEHTVFIEEARRLLETEKVDAIVGGASVVARDLAHRYPDVPFVATFWDEQEVTLRRPAANLFRFQPDYAQQAAGFGTYAYRTLGWRRAAVLAGDQTGGWAGTAAFTAEFCALGGRVVASRYRRLFAPDPDVVDDALRSRPDGVAVFLNFLDSPAEVLGPLARRLDDPARQLLLWAPDPRGRAAPAGPRAEAERRRRDELASVDRAVARASRLPRELPRLLSGPAAVLATTRSCSGTTTPSKQRSRPSSASTAPTSERVFCVSSGGCGSTSLAASSPSTATARPFATATSHASWRGAARRRSSRCRRRKPSSRPSAGSCPALPRRVGTASPVGGRPHRPGRARGLSPRSSR